MTTPRRLVLTIPEVCERLGLCRTTVKKLIRTKVLRSCKVGRRRLVREGDLERMLDRLCG